MLGKSTILGGDGDDDGLSGEDETDSRNSLRELLRITCVARGPLFDAYLGVVELLAGLKPGAYI